MGALCYIPETYIGEEKSLPTLDCLQQMALDILSEKSYEDEEVLYFNSGNSGGCRPKCLLHDTEGAWLVKFRHTYDPKDKDDKFIGFQIAYFRYEFLNLTKTQRNIIQEVLDRAYSDHSFELVEIIMALRSIHIAYYLTFAPTSDMSGEVAVYTYASSFLPFYKRCIEAKLYKPIR